jgi:DNA-binding CsgD family transcriptional regulator
MDDVPMSDHRLVGRDDELAVLRGVVRAVALGRGGGLVVRGPAGIGRTRLLQEATCTPAPPRGSAPRPLWLRGIRAERDLPGAAVHRLTQLLPRDDADDAADADDDAAQRDTDGQFALGVRILEWLRAAGPVLVLVDDAESLDSVSLEALGFAARRLDGSSAAIVFGATGESDDDDPLSGLPELRPGPLGEADARDLLRERISAHTPIAVPDDVLTVLADLGQGNPLALAECADALTEAQLLGTEPLPGTLPEGRMRRHHRRVLNAQPVAIRQLLLLAAMQPLDVDALLRAADETGLSDDTVDQAVAAGLLSLDGDHARLRDRLLATSIPVESTVTQRRAAHRALAEVLDHENHRLDRLWHRAMAGPPQATGAEGARRRRENLARELNDAAVEAGKSGDQLGASRCFERAAALTAIPGAAAEGLVTAARAAWLGGDVRRSRLLLGRARMLAATEELRTRIDLLLGEIELRSGSADRAYQALNVVAEGLTGPHRSQAAAALLRASEMYQLAGDHRRFLAAARRVAGFAIVDDDPLVRFMVAQFAGFSASFTGNHQLATEELRDAVALAPQCNDTSALILATMAAVNLGDERLSRELARQAVTLARSGHVTANLPVALEFLAFTEFRLDDYQACAAHAQEALTVARRAGQENSVAASLAILALLSTVTGDAGNEGTTELIRAQEAARQADGRGLCRPRSLTAWAAARMSLATGRPDTAPAALRALTAPDTDGPGRMHLTVKVLATPDLVEVAVKHGDPACVKAAMQTFEMWAGAVGGPALLGQISRCHALLSVDPDRAEEHFTAALTHLENASATFELARTQLLYGQALRRRRRPARARRYLREALEIFDSLDARGWAAQARAELRAAGGASSSPNTGSVPRANPEPTAPPVADSAALSELTPQQSEIARLVAGGATNREIAARLFLSPRTVDHHLRNIFVRLGVRSRVELTRLVG